MAEPQYVYSLVDLGKTFPGGRQILKNVHLHFLPGAKIGVLGDNGAGKSTLLKIMAGLDKSFTGDAFAADGLKIGYLAQEPDLDPDKDVLGNVMDGVAETKALLDKFNEVSMKFAEPLDDEEMAAVLEEQADLQEQIDALDAWDLEHTIDIAMDALRCPPGDADVTLLSGGERRRVALTRLLLETPDMLLLDEPTNHLDAESVAWLEHFLEQYPGMVVAITHDRYFLDNVAGWILEIDRGQCIPFEGNYSGWLQAKHKRLQHEKREEVGRQRQLAEELEWIRQSPRARQAKSKARISAYNELLQQRSEKGGGAAEIVIPIGQRLGDIVIEAKDLSMGYDDTLLVERLSFMLPPGGIVGIIGANGAGKTTLFRHLAGDIAPMEGTLKIGETVELGYVDQSRDTLNDENTVWEEVSDGLDMIEMGNRSIQSRAYVASFNFKGTDQQKKVGQLSGGERNRVHLAKVLKSGANVLLLDEPTNDLDMDTLRALEEALLKFAGCVVVITHDRWFLDRIATHILAFEGDSHAEWFEGNYADYEEDRKRRLGAAAEQPHRIKFKRFSKSA